MPETANREWYADGLRFTCTQCGNCCTGPKGYVWFNDEEAVAIASHLNLPLDGFLQTYARKVGGRWSLRETLRDGLYDCVFLKLDSASGRRVCSIYTVRPQQCRTWPFWSDNLRSPRTYRAVARETPCPGMRKGIEGEGAFYPIDKIRIQRDATTA